MAKINEIKVALLNQEVFHTIRAELQQTLSDIKMYIWVGELEIARNRLAVLLSKHGLLLWQAGDVKKNMTATYRNWRPRFEQQVKSRGITGIQQFELTQSMVAKAITLEDSQQDRLYLLSTFASNARRIDEYLAGQLKKGKLWSLKQIQALQFTDIFEAKTILSDQAQHQFKLSFHSFGPSHWEIRGYLSDYYRSIETSTNPPLILNMLAKRFDGGQVTIEAGRTEQGEITWPIWHRMFLDAAFIELKLYAAERFILFIAVHDETNLNALVNGLLECIHHTRLAPDEQ
jgi:hypothetical protein